MRSSCSMLGLCLCLLLSKVLINFELPVEFAMCWYKGSFLACLQVSNSLISRCDPGCQTISNIETFSACSHQGCVCSELVFVSGPVHQLLQAQELPANCATVTEFMGLVNAGGSSTRHSCSIHAELASPIGFKTALELVRGLSTRVMYSPSNHRLDAHTGVQRMTSADSRFCDACADR